MLIGGGPAPYRSHGTSLTGRLLVRRAIVSAWLGAWRLVAIAAHEESTRRRTWRRTRRRARWLRFIVIGVGLLQPVPRRVGNRASPGEGSVPS